MDLDKDIENFSKALDKFWNTNEKEREEMACKAREALDQFRPNNIRNRWKELSSEEREIFFDAVEALSNKNQAIIREMVNKS